MSTATSPGPTGVAGGDTPAWASISSSRSWAPSRRSRREPPSAAGGGSSRKSSSEVVTTVRTGVPSSVAAPSSDSSATSVSAPASESCRASSSPRSIGLHATAIAPSFHVASSASAYCGTFWSWIATRSPGATPSSASPAASASESSSARRTVSGVSK